MSYARPEAIVEPAWLSKHLGDPNIVIIDASFHLPTANRDPKEEYVSSHIPGAVFFDINEIADQKVDLPHMLPNPNDFQLKVGELGISENTYVICYDTNGSVMAGMRAFWTFKVFGHKNIAVLNGGFNKWTKLGYPVSNEFPKTKLANYTCSQPNPALVTSIEEVKENVKKKNRQFVDARTAGRFCGTEPEPRPGLKGGHVPNSKNLAFQEMLQTDNYMELKSANDLRILFMERGIDPSQPIISSCGSGVTAAVLYFSLFLIGYDTVSVYDGSWTEWGSQEDTPVAKGPE